MNGKHRQIYRQIDTSDTGVVQHGYKREHRQIHNQIDTQIDTYINRQIHRQIDTSDTGVVQQGYEEEEVVCQAQDYQQVVETTSHVTRIDR